MDTIKKKLDYINIILLSVFPLALAMGPALAEILTFTLILFYLILRREIKFEKKELFIFLLYFFLILSSITSDFKLNSLKSSIFLIRLIILFYIFKYYFEHNMEKILNLTFSFLTFTLIFLIFDGFYQFFIEKSFFGTEMVSEGRMVMHFRDESIMGGFLSKTLPIYIGIWAWKFQDNSYKINLLILIVIFLSTLCIILSNERSATFFILFFFITIVLISNLKFKIKSFIFILILFIFTLTILSVPSVKYRYLDATRLEILGKNDSSIKKNDLTKTNQKYFFDLKFNEKKLFLFSTAHEASIKTAINMFTNNLMLGIGPNNFRFLCSADNYGVYPERGCTTHPHHVLSQILSETGIIGLFFYTIFFLVIIFKIFKKKFKFSISKASLYAFYIILLLPILPSGNIFNNWYLFSITLPFFYLRKIK